MPLSGRPKHSRKQGADPGLIDEFQTARKAKVNEQDKEVAAKIDSIWKTELQNRLEDIDREKKAWEQKGLDEVKATKWAEKEKLDEAYAALEVLRSEKEQLQVFQQYGKAGLMEYIRQESGFTMEDLRLTPDQLQRYQEAKQSVMWKTSCRTFLRKGTDHREKSIFPRAVRLWTGFPACMENGMEKAMERLNPPPAPSAELPAAGQAANTAPAVSVSVNIENAVTQDNEGMRIRPIPW